MESQLAQSVRGGHRAIAEIIGNLRGLSRSYTMAKPYIREVSDRLCAHFGKQNDAFFGRLRSFYSDNREATKIIEFLVDDLKEIQVHHITFIEKHSGEVGDMSARSFPRDLESFSSEILTRIEAEEEYLFPLLENIPPV